MEKPLLSCLAPGGCRKCQGRWEVALDNVRPQRVCQKKKKGRKKASELERGSERYKCGINHFENHLSVAVAQAPAPFVDNHVTVLSHGIVSPDRSHRACTCFGRGYGGIVCTVPGQPCAVREHTRSVTTPRAGCVTVPSPQSVPSRACACSKPPRPLHPWKPATCFSFPSGSAFSSLFSLAPSV